MAQSRHYIDGVQVDEPTDWQSLEVTLDFTKDSLEPTISFDTLEFTGDTAKSIISYLDTNGYYQGIRYRYEAGDLLDPALTFNGFLDATQNFEIKACDLVQIALKKEQGKDWLVEMADSFSFRYLASNDYNGPGKITNSDYKGVPYIINYIPDGVQLILLSISAFMLAKELVESIQSIAKQTTDLIEGATPVVSTDVPVGVSTGWSLGKIIGNVLKLAVTIAYTIGVIVALVKLIEQIIEQLAPKKRFHQGMGVKDLVVKGCEYLGLTLESDLLDSLDGAEKWVIIPSKGHKGGEPPTGTDAGGWVELGIPNASDGVDTLGDLIRFIESTWNASYKLQDGVLRIERKDYWDKDASYIIPNTYNNQEQLRNEYSFNTEDLKSNYVIVWDDDLQDQNTLDNKNGKVYQAVTSVKNVQDQELINLKGLERISIPMSMAIRKDKLTAVEEALKVFLQAADFLSGQLDQPQSFASQFSARIGSMHLSSHFTSRPKMVVMAGSKLALDQRNIMSAQRLWEEYHFINSFVTVNDKNNQQIIFKEQPIEFCTENFVSLVGNNFATTEEGERAEIMRVVWNVQANSAVIDYRVFRVYDTNLEIKYLSV